VPGDGADRRPHAERCGRQGAQWRPGDRSVVLGRSRRAFSELGGIRFGGCGQ